MNKIFVFVFVLLVGNAFAQQTTYVNFKSADVSLNVSIDSSQVDGRVAYTLVMLQNRDSIFLDAVDMQFENLAISRDNEQSTDLKYSYSDNKIYFKYPFQKNATYKIEFNYSAKPKKALYFVKRENEPQIWSQGQGKYTSNWLPSLDDVNDKIEFDIKCLAPKQYQVLSNGVLKSKSEKGEQMLWEYDMQRPMSSYLVALTIGKYNKKSEISTSGVPLEYYYYPEDSLKVEPTYRYSKQMFNFLEEEIGLPYPWQNYKQVPVHDFLYAGMENTSLTIFSDAFVVDNVGFNDKNYVNVNAHELAHQWFGDLVTAKSGEHHWLQEGFATYYALLAERDIFGEDYFYNKLLESVLELSQQELSGNGTSLLDAASSSLTFYQRGAWVLHVLRDKVGDVVFRAAVQNYLKKHQFGTVETSDFIVEVEKLYGKSLTNFVSHWIKDKEFPFDEAYTIIKRQSTFINEYAMVDCEAKSSKCADYLKYYVSDEAKVKIIAQVSELVTPDVFKNSLKVRQAISEHVTKIPQNLKLEYESLLDDKSYITIENALYNLWVNFPMDRSQYLSKTRKVIGFNDKNVRMLWIVLNLNTPYYDADNKQILFDELLEYSSENYNADVRIKAFNYLNLIKSCNAECQSNLETAKSHHNWRLVKFAKQLSETLEQKED